MSTTFQKCSWAYGNFVTVVAALRSPLMLAIRLYWGFQFMQTGWGKLQNLQRVTGFFASLGIPFPHANAIFVSGLEFVGGILLILGLGSRLLALLLAGDMVVAYLTADREALLAIFSDPSKFFNASPFTFLFASLLILILGPGVASIDALIARVSRRALLGCQGQAIHPREAEPTRVSKVF
jgi:putative oxidoreductase